ncbi:uncharacterized protein BDZ99DRAFT_28350 [Mytilinidion resinicola]|uniref:Uncharacterized protein n=1 Tax=Mytilinidion resinicola TaxID=574789 RepID=A0A6A6YKU9_9PEZI|nr:uncharacterized protein BDZ99DRAFT_28350 [Mytilinidion resinicola]KAF2809420.1 hypothetical protein BDZ99DRAFT_28350 [Mytilinidion resinicola]
MSSTKSYSTSYISSSSTINGHTTSVSEETHTDPEGTIIYRTSQKPGEDAKVERVRVPSGGAVEGGEKGRIEDVTDNDKEYEERMEDEYAKREGGA